MNRIFNKTYHRIMSPLRGSASILVDYFYHNCTATRLDDEESLYYQPQRGDIMVETNKHFQ